MVNHEVSLPSNDVFFLLFKPSSERRSYRTVASLASLAASWGYRHFN